MLSEWSGRVDWTLVVAPEFDDLLGSRCRLVESSGGRLLGPSSSFVALAADKQRTAEHLTAAGVRVPEGISFAAGDSVPDTFSFPFLFPAVIKPRFGAGSEGVRHVALASEVRGVGQCLAPTRVERFCAGLAASVAFLCGPNNRHSLPPCRQRLSDDGEFRYLGGATPLAPELSRRATALASLAVAALPSAAGYLGVDLVLGDNPDGRDDVVIEVNPRLTTSYVGLRALALENLAAAMLTVAAGEVPRLSFSVHPLEFDADGTIRHPSPLTDSSAMTWLALDIGGANIKVADGKEFAVSSVFPLWKKPKQLADALRTLIAGAPRADHLVATMSGELADCFATKAEGVQAIVQAFVAASDGRHVRIYLNNGTLVAPQIALKQPLLAAAANWHALAFFAGRYVPMGAGLAIDIGSTTCDIVPLADGTPAATATTDPERLLASELGLHGCRAESHLRVGELAPLAEAAVPGGARILRDDLGRLPHAGRFARRATKHPHGRRPSGDKRGRPRPAGANDLRRSRDVQRERRRGRRGSDRPQPIGQDCGGRRTGAGAAAGGAGSDRHLRLRGIRRPAGPGANEGVGEDHFAQ